MTNPKPSPHDPKEFESAKANAREGHCLRHDLRYTADGEVRCPSCQDEVDLRVHRIHELAEEKAKLLSSLRAAAEALEEIEIHSRARDKLAIGVCNSIASETIATLRAKHPELGEGQE